MNLRDLPQVDALSRSPDLAEFPVRVRMLAARAAISELRKALLTGRTGPSPERLAAKMAIGIVSASLRPAINASGVILHTGLGRARLADEAVAQVAAIASSHALVEVDIDTGRRGDRQSHVRGMLQELTGAEDAFVVNNCAAAVVLSLTALSARKEVILSRGQMVEIGGSFRMAEIIKQSGCRLVEIGATNKTSLEDYGQAVTTRTAAIMRCHPSNFKVVGFTEEPTAAQLADLAHRHRLILIDDVGSGCLVDTTRFGLPKEPLLGESLAAGADIVTCSGDKMLGGPQAGIILGKAELIKRVRKHSLARAVRIDKLTLAALEATLRLYVTGEEHRIPTIRYLSRTLEDVRADAETLRQAYRGKAVIKDGITEVGGGSLPGSGVPTVRTGLQAAKPEKLASALRNAAPPILSRIEDDLVWLDPRTMDPDEVTITAALLEGLSRP